MSWLSRLAHDLRSLVRRGDLEREMDEELRAHLDLLADRNEREGMGPAVARRAARLELGSLDGVKEAVRDAGPGRVAEDFGKDLRHGARMLARAPGFAVAAVLTLALGIGATTAIFSVVHAVLIRPLPYDEPERLALVWSGLRGQPALRSVPRGPRDLPRGAPPPAVVRGAGQRHPRPSSGAHEPGGEPAGAVMRAPLRSGSRPSRRADLGESGAVGASTGSSATRAV